MSNATNCMSAAAVRMTIRFPFWAELFYSMGVVELPADHPEIQTQATDGRTLWVNTGFFKGLPLEQQVAEIVHELMHKMFLHCSRQGSREAYLWNVACDYAVNALMKENGFVFPTGKPGGWLLDMQYAGMSAEAIYADLLKKRKDKQGGTGKPGEGDPQLGPRQDIRKMEGTPEQVEQAEMKIKALVDRAIANAKARGNLPKGIEAGTVECYKPSKEPWYNHLHRFMQSLALGEYNWAKLNRRTLRTHGYFSPHHLAESLGDIAVFLDTSGSCFSAAAQSNFAGHLNAILAEAKPHRVMVYYFDSKVYPGETIDAGMLDFVSKPKGGGGTSFEPIFQALEDDNIVPEVCLILTDMMGSFPSTAPEYPVVWCSTEGITEAPFGDVICVE